MRQIGKQAPSSGTVRPGRRTHRRRRSELAAIPGNVRGDKPVHAFRGGATPNRKTAKVRFMSMHEPDLACFFVLSVDIHLQTNTLRRVAPDCDVVNRYE